MKALELSKKYKTQLEKFEINSPLRKAHFFAQIDHESSMKAIRENLFYSTIAAAKKAFYTPFRGKSDAFISQYLRNPQKMANYVYANRNGNGNESTGDGWKYRAGGMIGTTGKANFERLSAVTGVDYVEEPDLLNNEADSLIAALVYWKDNKLNSYADQDKIDSISDIINKGRITAAFGDANGFQDRANKLKLYKEIFK
ncbi:glycoside hydrolase family 19 protein [Chryseobacterium sp. NFX27]|uniref:glycoside hydrolase family 19 protein n=1 Tax=Chryseobacterium sp. NFX27 TaxID=2819618 RepID=UPI003CF94513